MNESPQSLLVSSSSARPLVKTTVNTFCSIFFLLCTPTPTSSVASADGKSLMEKQALVLTLPPDVFRVCISTCSQLNPQHSTTFLKLLKAKLLLFLPVSPSSPAQSGHHQCLNITPPIPSL